MSALHPALEAELAGTSATVFDAVKIVLPDATLRLLDGSAEIDLPEGEGSALYSGESELAALGDFEDFEDGTGDDAPRMNVTLLPVSDAAAAELSDPAVQGAEVIVSIGARNDATGQVIGEPYVLLVGEVDVPQHRVGRGTVQVTLDCVGGMERLFFNDEGIRLAQAFHEQVWPDETGFAAVTGVIVNDYWGMDQ